MLLLMSAWGGYSFSASVSWLLRTSNGLNLGEFDNLEVHYILRSFGAIFTKNYVFYVFLASGMVFFYILQVFWPFYPKFNPKWVYLDPNGHPQIIMPVEGRKNGRMWRQSSPRMVQGVSFFILILFWHFH